MTVPFLVLCGVGFGVWLSWQIVGAFAGHLMDSALRAL